MKHFIQLKDDFSTILELSELFYININEDDSELELFYKDRNIILTYNTYKENERLKYLKEDLEYIKSLINIESDFVPKSELINVERSSDEEIERLENEIERLKDLIANKIVENTDLENNLLLIKSKWWYKLFTLFSH